MAQLPKNIQISFGPAHQITNVHWDEESQMYRATVDGEEFGSYRTAEVMREIAHDRRRSAAAFEAMANCAEVREKENENRRELEEANRARLRSQIMREAGYICTDAEGYKTLGGTNPHARRLVDLAVEARLKLEGQA